VRRNFKADLFATVAIAASVALLAVGIAESAPLLPPIAVGLAAVTVVAKFALSADRRRHTLPNSPRRRACDRDHEEETVPTSPV
jgi:hypothetical protein